MRVKKPWQQSTGRVQQTHCVQPLLFKKNLTGKEGQRVNRPSVSNDRNDSYNFWALRRNRSQLGHISAQNLCGKKWLFPIEGMFGFSIPNECCAFPRGKKNFCWKNWLPANKHETQNAWKARRVWTSACRVTVTMSSSGRKQEKKKNQLTTLKTAFPAFHNKTLILSHIPVIFSNYASLQFVVLISLFDATQN